MTRTHELPVLLGVHDMRGDEYAFFIVSLYLCPKTITSRQ